MEINSDFSKRAIVHSQQTAWVASPMPGVDRRMLDRIGDEVARATTIVRYAPESAFSAHTHTGGEEFIVLDGVFEDEHGDYPEGTYVRNPPMTAHTPSSKEYLGAPMNGVSTAKLHQDEREIVTYHHLDTGAVLENASEGGLELFVIGGSGEESGDALEKGSWLRLPDGDALSFKAGAEGAKIWMKTGHLNYAHVPKAA